jgi:hypothetical protein
LLSDAREAGYVVEIGLSCVDIFKVNTKGRSLEVGGKSIHPISRGIRIYADGTANRMDVELGSTTLIRTQKMMRKILGLTTTGRN